MHYAKFLCTAAWVMLGTAAQAQSSAGHVGAPHHPAVASEAEVAKDIQQLCASEWPSTHPALQSHCIDKQSEARSKAQEFASNASPSKASIWARCSKDWTNKAGQQDWVMTARCLDFQVQAYKE